MAQHFLLSTAARTLSLSAVARMSEEEARATFQRIRWADNDGEPYCPRCGVALRHQRDKGIVRAAQGPGQYMIWEIAR